MTHFRRGRLVFQQTPNTAIHLSRIRLAIFFADHTLRPGDGKRYAVSSLE
jgi:hypothetical protein